MSEKLKRLLDKGRKALAHKQYEAAGALFEEAVTLDAGTHAGWFGLGEVALAIGQQDTAVQFLEEAVKLQPDAVKYLQRLGELYGRIGHAESGVEVLLAARRKAPKDAGVLASLSGAYVAMGNWYKAKEVLQALVRLPHPKAGHFCLLGLAAQGIGELDDALKALKRATRMDPQYPDAWVSLGHLHLQKKHWSEAEECLEHLFKLAPQQLSTLWLAGDLAMGKGNYDEAASFFRTAIAQTEDSAALQVKLTVALMLAGKTVEAVDAMSRANELGVKEAWILEQLGYVFTRNSQLDAAQENLEMSLERNPDNLNAMNTLFVVYSKQGKSGQARQMADRILEKNPNHINALINLGGWYSDQARTEEAIAMYRRVLELDPGMLSAYTNHLWALVHSSEHVAADTLEAARAYDLNVCQPYLRQRDFSGRNADPERKLRIGWLTSDLRQHPVAAFVLPFLGLLDRSRLEILVYHNTLSEDAMTAVAKMMTDKWREVRGLGDDALADLMAADEIDVLVDLNGNTEGHRLPVLARNPAPIQVTWLGFPGTSGISTMDYIFIPPDPFLEKGGWCIETPWPLPDCYGVRTGIPEVSIQPGLPCERLEQPFTFACLNNFRKASRLAIRLWSEILSRTPGSRLALVGRSGKDEAFRQYVEAQFAQHGIGPERLEIKGMMPQVAYFDCYNEVDLCLDPFPFNGGTTGYDAIWMGVPFVTWPGDSLVSRMGRIILKNVGLDELVVDSAEAYVELAVSLANDHERLKSLRANLRERMLASPLMDAPRMARNLEQAFREMWRRWVEHRASAPVR
jgi:predicted O-linked N-acetylglucosamine transferase (SPINDLY family)